MKITAEVTNKIGQLSTTKRVTVELAEGDEHKIKRVAEELLLQASGDEIVGDASDEVRYHA